MKKKTCFTTTRVEPVGKGIRHINEGRALIGGNNVKARKLIADRLIS
jgi:hypothetical protein